MSDYSELYQQLQQEPRFEEWAKTLPQKVEAAFTSNRYGNLPKWQAALAMLPEVQASTVNLDQGTITIGLPSDCSDEQRVVIEQSLRQLHPWRKGPYNIHDVHINTEWRSDWKWDRLEPHIACLKDRKVLDVGCGSGYHSWRMAGAGARLVIGIDPVMVYIMQYLAVRHFAGDHKVYVLPLTMEDLPTELQAFDTVFSMGVLYHRRSPLDHLIDLRDALRPGGELVLETLVIDGGLGHVLTPEQRYAKMRNVWFIPTCATMELWLKRAGFANIRTVDVTTTTIEEQRSTLWMHFESLQDFLDPDNSALTIEGYPAPKRAIFIANR